MDKNLDQELASLLKEAKKYKTCMSLVVSDSAVELYLDTSIPTYSEWIPGEGADIALYRSQENNKVVGCRLPLYDDKLSATR